MTDDQVDQTADTQPDPADQFHQLQQRILRNPPPHPGDEHLQPGDPHPPIHEVVDQSRADHVVDAEIVDDWETVTPDRSGFWPSGIDHNAIGWLGDWHLKMAMIIGRTTPPLSDERSILNEKLSELGRWLRRNDRPWRSDGYWESGVHVVIRPGGRSDDLRILHPDECHQRGDCPLHAGQGALFGDDLMDLAGESVHVIEAWGVNPPNGHAGDPQDPDGGVHVLVSALIPAGIEL